MGPQFARPESTVVLPSRNALVAFLDEFHVPYHTWNNHEAHIDELWKEIENGDTVYLRGLSHGSIAVPVRFLITIAIRVVLRHPVLGILVLIEFVRDGDYYCLRRYTNSSTSEKGKLNPNGTLAEDILYIIQRCLREEVCMSIPRAVIEAGLQFMRWPVSQLILPGAEFVEQHFHEKKRTQPGLWHLNQVAHYTLNLPEEYHFLGWRMDQHAGARYLSRWGSVHEDSSRLDPVPVHQVLGK